MASFANRSAAVLLVLLGACAGRSGAPRPFVIRVVDEATGRGVPMVELRTTSGLAQVTDNGGIIAFDEPGLLGTRVFFFVQSHGYERPPDGFGFRGVSLETAPGGEATVRVRRTQIAERLYRITGQGLYHDSVRAGLPVPLRQPLLNAGVTGQDTAVVLVHRGKIRWLWGDTNLSHRALGHFGTATATSELPGRGGLDPSVGVDLTYAADAEGFSRPTFDLGVPGAVWVHGGFVLRDPDGRERILAQYERVKELGHRLELGIAVFDDDTERFRPLVKLELKEQRHPFGQPFRAADGGVDYVYFALPHPVLRVRARWDDVLDPERYEAFTCLKAGVIERDAGGRGHYAWRKGEAPIGAERQEELIRAGRLKSDEAWIRTVEAATGKEILLHRGSVRWNAWRKRWIMIATRRGGEDSFLGDVYYAESAAPHGPWTKAVKVAGHRKYTFYNPVHHEFFDQEGGRLIYFEGTYTMTFSETTVPTPRYDYNQVMYRLDLADPRLEGARIP